MLLYIRTVRGALDTTLNSLSGAKILAGIHCGPLLILGCFLVPCTLPLGIVEGGCGDRADVAGVSGWCGHTQKHLS